MHRKIYHPSTKSQDKNRKEMTIILESENIDSYGLNKIDGKIRKYITEILEKVNIATLTENQIKPNQIKLDSEKLFDQNWWSTSLIAKIGDEYKNFADNHIEEEKKYLKN